MGLCMSSGGAAVAAVRSEGLAASTAMVLLPTGELREYPRPATVAQALQDSVEAGDGSAGWFLCDADVMGFEGPVDETLAYKTVPTLVVKRRPVARVKSAGRMQPRVAPDLTAIPECE
uniref:Uncharacterized protein n=1 Tax=Aegilops tauschii TaxID=37682 RepID=M8BGP9_AEGTA